MIKLYIDCTSTYRHNLNTGIQRVVRNITANLLQIAPARGIECVPVICSDGAFHPCQVDEHGNLVRPWYMQLVRPARTTLHGVRRTLCWVLPFRAVYAFCYASQQEFGLLFVAHKMLAVVRGAFRLVRRPFAPAPTVDQQPSGHTGKSILLCADAGFTYLEELQKTLPPLRANGTTVITVIYDLIPINYSHYCNLAFTKAFDAWVRFAIAHSHGLLCISDAVRAEVGEFLQKLPAPKPPPDKLDYFHLGFELDLVSSDASNAEIRTQVFADDRPVFLMVGTIEPRKNHQFVLHAFERLWSEGRDYKLCFVGRYGWNTGDLIARLNAHPERGKRLFVLTDVPDADLEYAYTKAHGLICASLTEGFGLPIVEAFAHRLPVLASDIPVFREIAGSAPVYFNPLDVESLHTAIVEYCAGGRAEAQTRMADFSPLSWQQSAEMLLDRVLRLADVGSARLTTAPAAEPANVNHERRTPYRARSKSL